MSSGAIGGFEHALDLLGPQAGRPQAERSVDAGMRETVAWYQNSR